MIAYVQGYWLIGAILIAFVVGFVCGDVLTKERED